MKLQINIFVFIIEIEIYNKICNNIYTFTLFINIFIVKNL